MLFLHNTSRVEDEPYPTLLQDKGFRGFPSLCFMDAEGNVLTKPSRSVEAFRETHAQTKSLMALRDKKGRTAEEEKELFLAELELDLIPAEEIQQRADAVKGLGEADKKLVAQKLVDAEVGDILRSAREVGMEETQQKLVAIARAGRVPSAAMAGTFWQQVLRAASADKDAKLAQQAYDALMERYADESGPQFERAKKAWSDLVEAAKQK